MKERGILFSAPMVRALLAGTKTQTRRLLQPQPELAIMDAYAANALSACKEAGIVPTGEQPRWRWKGCFHMPWPHCMRNRSPYGVPGDRLWVREAFAKRGDCEDGSDKSKSYLLYRASYESDFASEWHSYGRWRPGIHMPRWASRLTLEVTEVRVQRLQEISEEDAKAEGVRYCEACDDTGVMRIGHDPDWCDDCGGSAQGRTRDEFAALWDQINGDRATWASNPWVWAITFTRVGGSP